MRFPLRLSVLGCLFLAFASASAATPDWVLHTESNDAIRIAGPQTKVALRYDPADAEVVAIAAEDLAADLERVTGRRPTLNASHATDVTIHIGTLGKNAAIDSLPSLDDAITSRLSGKWESFVITSVAQTNGSSQSHGIAIIGSDPRGAAFGVYEFSKAIGVSPWHWWADVPPKQAESLWIKKGTRHFGPPSVKYRGIFLNDEDWGLHPWAAHTFDPELGDIGPRTYEKVFELLLRLKANTLWPAMHEVTKAFNLYPENKRLAGEYAMVMGSSHAEPMLRNNVTEWTEPHSHFNYITHPDLVLDYWEQRVRENASFENIYTLGMRGIHDSGMTGTATMQDRVDTLSRIFRDQRRLLSQYVDADLTEIPQAFTPYKEVLEIYRAGLEVPEEVTLVWPDDNHGYIRYLPNADERQRSGGSGVYYHLSYLGSPMAYLWLATTPPALIWEEMRKAYETGAREIWIANVGDIKPAEITTEFFLQMAWDIDRWNLNTLPNYVEHWAAREFGDAQADRISQTLNTYYQLNYERRPEHLQWWLPHTRVRSSDLDGPATQARLTAFADLIRECDTLEATLADRDRDAFFQLVSYPVKASAFANLRYFHNEQYARLFNAAPADAREHAARALYADDQIEALTRRYNKDIADGKWDRFMAPEPADANWRSYRLSPLPLPSPTLAAANVENPLDISSLAFSPRAKGDSFKVITIEAEAFDDKKATADAHWETIPGLGRSGASVASYPILADRSAPPDAATLSYGFSVEEPGDYRIRILLIPTFPLPGAPSLRLAVSIDDGPIIPLAKERDVNTPEWKQAVLTHQIAMEVPESVALSKGEHRITLFRVDSGVVIDQIQIERTP